MTTSRALGIKCKGKATPIVPQGP